MEAVFAEWRRAGSRCGGGLVWFLNDMAEGAGWGVIDDRGQPKVPWYALRRAFQPIHLGLTDEGLNGLGIHVSLDNIANFYSRVSHTRTRIHKSFR